MDNPFLWILIIIVIAIVSREIACWYWKVNDIIKNQNEQLNLMDDMLYELRMQNITLRVLMGNDEKEEKEDKESTP